MALTRVCSFPSPKVPQSLSSFSADGSDVDREAEGCGRSDLNPGRIDGTAPAQGHAAEGADVPEPQANSQPNPAPKTR